MSESTVHFRPSACGKFVVVVIGAARPHVIPLAEANALVGEYSRNADLAQAEGKVATARLELAHANALAIAIREAMGG